MASDVTLAVGDKPVVLSIESNPVVMAIGAARGPAGPSGVAVQVIRDTRANLYSYLTPVAETLALVYNDATQAYNGVYVKLGAAGVGSWQLTNLYFPVAVQAIVQGYMNAAAASATAAHTSELNAAISEANAAAVQAAVDADAAAAVAAMNTAIAAASVYAIAAVFDTKAAANAGLAGIAANAVVQVVFDESMNGARTLYRKVSGAYVFLVLLEVTQIVPVNTSYSAATNSGILAAAIASHAPYSQYNGGAVKLVLPGGQIQLSHEIDLTGCHGLNIGGQGDQGTELIATGNFAVFGLEGTGAAALQSVCIQDMLITGGGKASANAHGIRAKYTNSCLYRNLKFYKCRHAIDLTKVWQDRIEGVRVVGGGGLQNYAGLWFNETDVAEPNNAAIVSNYYAENYEFCGVRAINAQGSKFLSGECNGGQYGFYAGAPTTGTYKLEFMHIGLWLCDSNYSHQWLFQQGAASVPIANIQGANLWAGGAGGADCGLWFEGVTNSVFGIIQSKGNAHSGIVLYNSSKMTFGSMVMSGNNIANDPNSADVLLNGANYCSITNLISEPLHGKSVLEINTSNSNVIGAGSQLFGGATIIGVDSKVEGPRGYLYDSTTNTPGTITAGSRAAIQVMTVAGAALGDDVRVTFSLDREGLALTAWVSAADTVSYQFSNPTAGSITKGVGVIRATVEKLRG